MQSIIAAAVDSRVEGASLFPALESVLGDTPAVVLLPLLSLSSSLRMDGMSLKVQLCADAVREIVSVLSRQPGMCPFLRGTVAHPLP